MTAKIFRTDDVYGIRRDIPLNYVTRTNVDNKFVEELTRDKHIVIYGSSKQGKTCLRKHALKSDDFIVVQCSNKWDIGTINSSILKQAGYQIVLSEKKSISGKSKVLASISASLFGAGMKGGAESERSTSTEITNRGIELDIEDVNDVIKALNEIEFNKYIIMEDFHYLPTETQKDFSVGLKAFHEGSKLCFIIIGVWLEKNRLIVFNGDLTGRVISIDADEWTREELNQVIDEGGKLLNIQFSEDFKMELLDRAQDSVYIVQEVCRSVCRKNEIYETQKELKSLGPGENVELLVKEVVDQQTGRYQSFITNISSGFQETELEMYKWILYPIITSATDQLRQGLSYTTIRKILRDRHPKGNDLNLGNLTQALQYISALQVKKDIKPIILDYDQTNRRLSVVDKGFIVWLAYQDKEEILDTAGFDAS